MIDQRGCPVADGIYQAHVHAGGHILSAQGAIQTPPQALQDLWEIGRRFPSSGRDAAGESAIEMRVRADQPRHHQRAAGVQAFIIGVLPLELRSGPDLDDAVACDLDSPILDQRAALVERGHCPVDDQHSSLLKK